MMFASAYQQLRTLLGVRNLILVGLTGSGKTSVGRRLAFQLKLGFLDLDELIENSGYSIAEMVSEQGLAYFRDCESRCLSQISGVQNHVLSLGSGVLLKDENRKIVKSLGFLVCLHVNPAVIARRLLADTQELKKRPLLSDLLQEENADRRQEALKNRLQSLYEERMQHYQEAALVLEANYSPVDLCVRQLTSLVLKSLKDTKAKKPSSH